MSNMSTVLPDSLHWLYNRCKAPTFNCWIYSTVYPCLSVASIICFDQPSNSNNVLFISSYCSGMEKNNAALCIDVLLQQVSCAVCFGCMFVHQLKMPPLISPKCMCWVWGPGHLGRIGSPVCVSGCHPHARVPNMYRATASAGC